MMATAAHLASWPFWTTRYPIANARGSQTERHCRAALFCTAFLFGSLWRLRIRPKLLLGLLLPPPPPFSSLFVSLCRPCVAHIARAQCLSECSEPALVFTYTAMPYNPFCTLALQPMPHSSCFIVDPDPAHSCIACCPYSTSAIPTPHLPAEGICNAMLEVL